MLQRVAVLVLMLASVRSARALTIDQARLEATLTDAVAADSFKAKLRLGGASGIAVAQVPLRVQVGDVVVDLPAGALRRRRSAWVWKSGAAGVRRVTLKTGRGTLDVAGGGVELGQLTEPVRIEVAFGGDAACATLAMVGQAAGRPGAEVAGGPGAQTTSTRPARRRGRKTRSAGGPTACTGGPGVVDLVPPTVRVTSPTGDGGISFASPTITLGGVAHDDVGIAGLAWANDRGGGASMPPADTWTIADIPLAFGDNVLTVSVTDLGGNVTTDTLVATRNENGLVFDGVPTASPDALFLLENAEVLVRQAIVPNPDLDPESVRLVRITDGGTKVPVGTMSDDGNLTTGDEIHSDGVHSGKIELGGIRLQLQVYRVAARTLSQPDLMAWSPVMVFPILEHVSQEQLDAAIALANEARAALETHKAQGVPQADALAQVVALVQQRGALAAGPAEDGAGAWWVNASGLLGGILGHDQAALRAAPGPRSAATTSGAGVVRAPSAVAAPAGTVMRPDAAGSVAGSRRVAILAPYFADQEAVDVAALFAAQQCPPYDVDVFTGSEAGAERFQSLEQYGLVLIASHGDALFHDVGEAYHPEWGWSTAGAQVVLLTGTTLGADDLATWERDLRLGRMTVLPDGIAGVLPTFVARHSGRFPSTVVFAGSCRSSHDASLSNVFLGQGAGAFYGFDRYVATDFAQERAVALVSALVEGQTTGAAFTPGLSDGGSPPATFTMAGRGDVVLSDGGIANAGFEHASGVAASVPGWIVAGDGRVIGGLGPAAPTQGARMAIISTGLGLTDDSGSITQSICLPPLPAGATRMTLSWDWDFFSEEFLEFCGSMYQDSFSVDFDGVVLQSVAIDALCDTVAPVDVRFDKGDVHATGWRTTTADVTALAGRSGRLTFAAHDVGDSIYDSAILIDRLTLTVE